MCETMHRIPYIVSRFAYFLAVILLATLRFAVNLSRENDSTPSTWIWNVGGFNVELRPIFFVPFEVFGSNSLHLDIMPMRSTDHSYFPTMDGYILFNSSWFVCSFFHFNDGISNFRQINIILIA